MGLGLELAIVAVVGLLIGLWLGLPGRYDQRAEDIERAMETGSARRRKLSKRSVNPFAWVSRRADARRSGSSGRPTRKRGSFRLDAPDEDR